MKIHIKGIGPDEITQRHFVAKGGEGEIYIKGKTAYKIYINPADCLSEQKLRELASLTLPNIIKPERLILNTKNQSIGYTMKAVPKSDSLCKLFTKAFKTTAGITNDKCISLLHNLHDVIDHVHFKGIQIVDLNELNFLTPVSNYEDIYAIDVNSYQTPSYPATVIMPSIRDYHCKTFTDNSDWFSFGVLAFNLLIGIHPYRGNHPDFQIPMGERMEARMKKNVSVFHKDVTIPKVCESFDVIPPALRSWMVDVFENGKRSAPPINYEVKPVSVHIKHIVGSNKFLIKLLEEFEGDIKHVYYSGPTRIVITSDYLYINNHYYINDKDLLVGFCPKSDRAFAAYVSNDVLLVMDLATLNITRLGNTDGIFTSEGRIYSRIGNDILEVIPNEIGSHLLLTTKIVGRVLDMPNATKLYNGVVIQRVYARYVASIFIPGGLCYQINIPELDEYRVLDAKYQHKILVIIAEKGGIYSRFVFKLDDNFNSYVVHTTHDVGSVDINFTVNDNGVCILLNEVENIELFSNKKDSSQMTIISDNSLDNSMQLCYNGAKMEFTTQNKLYSISLK